MQLINLITKYRYHLFICFFVVWMSFIDSNNLFYRVKLHKEVQDLKRSLTKHKESIKELNRIQKNVLSNQQGLEIFARETYLMKKDDEDLFVIVNSSIIEN